MARAAARFEQLKKALRRLFAARLMAIPHCDDRGYVLSSFFVI
jgi:hypothetical protein